MRLQTQIHEWISDCQHFHSMCLLKHNTSAENLQLDLSAWNCLSLSQQQDSGGTALPSPSCNVASSVALALSRPMANQSAMRLAFTLLCCSEDVHVCLTCKSSSDGSWDVLEKAVTALASAHMISFALTGKLNASKFRRSIELIEFISTMCVPEFACIQLVAEPNPTVGG